MNMIEASPWWWWWKTLAISTTLALIGPRGTRCGILLLGAIRRVVSLVATLIAGDSRSITASPGARSLKVVVWGMERACGWSLITLMRLLGSWSRFWRCGHWNTGTHIGAVAWATLILETALAVVLGSLALSLHFNRSIHK